MILPMYVVDAFASRPFSGNPAAVCLLPPGIELSDTVRQHIAAEMNQSETAFLEPMPCSADSESTAKDFSTVPAFRLRWFTPICEVPCCGHATLASAAVLFQVYRNPHSAISFHTLSGELTVSRRAPDHTDPTSTSSSGASISRASSPLLLALSLPVYDAVDPVPPGVADPAGPLARACAGGLPVAEVRYCGSGGLNYLLMVLAAGVGQKELEELKPDFEGMMRCVNGAEVRGVIVCARTGHGATNAAASDEAPLVCSRFFAPWMGINEDSVTGSAHAVLGPYWQAALRPAGGGSGGPMRMRQCSARGGDLLVEVMQDEGRVIVSGPATLVLEATLRM